MIMQKFTGTVVNAKMKAKLVNGRRRNGITGAVINNIYATLVAAMKIKSVSLILTILITISNTSSARDLLPTSTTGRIVRHT
jgi:hypothetical protein